MNKSLYRVISDSPTSKDIEDYLYSLGKYAKIFFQFTYERKQMTSLGIELSDEEIILIKLKFNNTKIVPHSMLTSDEYCPER
jgi:hypothetical protein